MTRSANQKRRPKAKAKAKAKPKKPKTKRAKAKAPSAAKPTRAAKKPAAKRAQKPARSKPDRWSRFVERHGVVLASARGAVPSVAEAIAGEPIVGSWWAHPKAPTIFDALSSIDDADDIRCFKLVDRKITFVHRRLWPALVRLVDAGVLDRACAASIQQEHMPTGEHRNFTTPFPDWVPEDVTAAAAALSVDQARQQFGAWVR